MELQEFVTKVLVDLDKAVDEADKQTSRKVSFMGSQAKRTVEFDIAVAVDETGQNSGKAGIKVLEFVQAGGDMSRTYKNSTVSRISFGVYINPDTKANVRNRTGVVDLKY